MDLRAALFAFGVAMLIATVFIKALALAAIGAVFMFAATVYGWLRNQQELRGKVRMARRANPNGPARRPYYIIWKRRPDRAA